MTAGYDEKRAPNMGSRSTTRHGAQGAASAGGLAMLLQALVEAGKLDIQQAFLALAILTPIATTGWKVWDSLGVTARIRAWLDSRFPAAPLVAALLIPLAGGCAIQIGTADPEQFSTLGGGTMIACETRGITIAIGDADLCSNSARGGHVSRTFADMTLGVVRAIGAGVAAAFGGLGAAGAGMAAALDPAPEPPAPAPSAPAAPAYEFRDAPAAPSYEFRDAPAANPFTAPDPE